MAIREVKAAGHEALMLATELLQRARLADGEGGIWEAADVQWWWRKPRRSDAVEQLFWTDDAGPVAAVLLTSWTDSSWQCDPIIVPGRSRLEPGAVWERALEQAAAYAVDGFDVPVRDDDLAFKELVEGAGLVAGESDSTAWMAADDRPGVESPAQGFALVDRTQRSAVPHPMRHRNGDEVEARLAQCPLYDPELDLAIEAADGRVAGYSLYWFDPITKVGLVEPVRVEDEYQRRGLARAMLTAGIDRLAARGAQRIKVSYRTEPAGALYRGLGFQSTSTTTWYARVQERVRTGGCLCGAVRYSVRGEPLHVRRCHCADCRKESGSAFTVYAQWPAAAFEISGEVSSYDGRGFCPRCGSRLVDTADPDTTHIEIRIGSLDDAPFELTPDDEIWVKRRESWIPPVEGAVQHDES